MFECKLPLALQGYKAAQMGIIFLVLVITGCATTPTGDVESSEPIFYPALPEPPRIQYLTTFNSSMDVDTGNAEFASFVLGKDLGKDAYFIDKPYGVQIHEGKLYVVDTRGPGYAVFDLVNQEFNMVLGDGGGRMQKPINISFDKDGGRYISDTGSNKVLVFDSNDRFIKAYGFSDQFKPTDTAISGNKLFVVDVKDHEIEVLNKETGLLLYKIGKEGPEEGQFLHPTNLKIGVDNHLYVTDTSNFRVQKFTQEGEFVQQFGSIGDSLGQLSRPKGIALDRHNNLYVVDAAFENVQILNPEGQLLLYFGTPGTWPDSINLPADIEIDYDNVELFQGYAHPDFELEYIILVSSQFGANKVNVYGFGKMKGVEYLDDEALSSANK